MRTNHGNNDANTTQRHWHDLKPGDVIFFANGWFEVFDAYPVAKDTVLVKLAIRAPKRPTRFETHRVRVSAGSKATCRA
jgi:hypothetical protein